MAEFGAHLSGSIVGEKPSIFEVLATEGLANGLKLAFKHLITVIAQSDPSARYRLLYRYTDEIYLILDLVVQCYHLKKYSSSFSENFYCLRRSPDVLKEGRFKRSLFLLVAFPYLISLANKKYVQYKDDAANDKMKEIFVKFYPYIQWSSNSLLATYQLLYAVGKISHHSPLIQLANCQLRTLVNEDLEEKQDLNSDNYSWFSLRSIFRNTATTLASTMSMGAFFLQFVDWWYSQEGINKSITALPVPEPPKICDSSTTNGICPICNETIKNLTLLKTTGFVFCYRCIHQSLTANSKCPVTKYPADHSQLIKLYPPND